MGIRFSKSIKLGNLVKLNISKSGVSATIGKKGASINLGTKGTYLNLSPSAVGIKGTGVSYRKKVTGGLNDVIKKVTGEDDKKKTSKKENEQVVLTKDPVSQETTTAVQDAPAIATAQPTQPVDISVIDQYNENLEINTNLQKYAENVLTKEAFNEKMNTLESEVSKTAYQLLIDGDEDTIESSVGAFLNNLELSYDVRASYELEENVLYVDLDLPEIEDFSDEYPVLVKGDIVTKKKGITVLREEYAKNVIGLGIYLCANFFNISSFIDEIVISAFTSRRNNDGDIVDDYLYSVKYTRGIFEATDLSTVEDAYKFLLQFENRINISTSYVFKAVKPYEMPTVAKANSIVEDVVAGLKELGYKAADINRIVPALSEMEFESSSDCLKEALRLLANYQ